GGTQLKFGPMSTAVIVLQVALCVVFLPIAMIRTQDALGDRVARTGFPADEYLSGRLSLETETPLASMPEASRAAFLARTAELQEEVRRRLAGVPGISAVALANRVPGMNHPYESLQIEGALESPDSAAASWARVLSVGLNFFDAMDARIVSGRGFQPSDLQSGGNVAIVDQSFVEEVLGGRNPVGRWLRYPSRTGEGAERRYQIVGVVHDLGMNAFGPGGYQDLAQSAPAGYVGVYHPLRPGEAASVQLFLRTNAPNAAALVPGIHSIVTSLDPSLRLDDLMTVDELWSPAHRGERLISWVMAFVVLLVVGLAVAGIYALMSFVVSQRTREIGIRAALGADPRRIVLTIFSRALVQIGLGVLIGALVLGFTIMGTASGIVPVVGVAMLMVAVGLLACVQPARRALRIQPTEAIRAE
ncbi:MAG TPA: ABC transporter permease, partial [Longimicrobiaceae bacterium]|nr:ABC transporter permease [Longimicrobiaceae bacterium]